MGFLAAELVGRVGRVPEKKQGQTGEYLYFPVAYNAAGRDLVATVWVSCFWYGAEEGAEKQLGVGAEVFVRGRLSCRGYLSQDGRPRASIAISVSELKLLHKPFHQGKGMEPGSETEYFPIEKTDASKFYRKFEL